MALEEIQSKFGGKWKIEHDNTDSTVDSVELQVKDGTIVTTPYRQGKSTNTSLYRLNEETEVMEAGVKHRGWASYEGGKLTTTVKPMDSDVPIRTVVRHIVDGKHIATINSRGREWTSHYFK